MVKRELRFGGFLRVLMMALISLSVMWPVAESAASSSNKSKKPVASKTAKKQPSKATRKEATARKSTRTKTASARNKKGRTVVAQRREAGPGTIRTAARSSRAEVVRVAAPARLTVGERLGLRSSDDPLDLNSSVALVVDQDTSEVLFSKNDGAVLPIASLTKLMTGLVIADANLPMDEQITITSDDIDTYKGSRSRLAVGTTLSRGELMHLALMSSENRAAHALGRTFPGGMEHFVRLMNAKARELGMYDTRYVEPTGLLSQNHPAPGIWPPWCRWPTSAPFSASCPHHRVTSSTWDAVCCSTTTPTAWFTTRSGTLVCRRRGTSLRPVDAWSCKPVWPVAS